MADTSDTDGAGSLRVLWRLRAFLRPHRWRFVVALGLLLATTGLELAIPRVFGFGIDAIRAAGEQAGAAGVARWRDVVLRWAILFGGVILVANAARFVFGLVQASLQQHVLTDLRCAIYDAVQHLSLDYRASTTTGELISRGTRDVDRLRRVLSGALFTTVSLAVYVVTVIVTAAGMGWGLAVIALWPIPVSMYLLARFARRLRRMWRDVSDRYGEVTTVLQENIAGARVVRAFGRETSQIETFGRTADRYLTRTIATNRYWASRIPLAQLVFAFSIPLMFGYGGLLVGRGVMTVGDLAAFLIYLTNLTWRIRVVGRIVDIVQSAAASADRVFAVLDQPPTVTEREGARPMPDGAGRVAFRQVSFEHQPGTPTLRDITFTAEPGQMVAIVGRTGSGKTTLVSLIPRFHDPAAGTVEIDGVDVRDIRLRDLRASIGFIFQEPFLFSTTVAENIAYGRPDASPEEVSACACAAQAEEFVEQLEDGYDTVVGERGATLSGGQRQRLAIARAFLTDPRILIMDDATASVDSATERMIHDSLLDVARGRTTFIIAQRLSTVRRADLILVLDEGRIVERGTHDELLALDGAYRQIFGAQLAEVPEAVP